MSFRDQDWSARFGKLGDEAESAFEDVAEGVLGLRYVRFGLDRPPLQVHRLPARIRYTPDYLMTNKFVEVQGFGRDQKIKLKLSKHGALRWWNDVHPVELFLWDSHHRRWCFITLAQLEGLITAGHVTLASFHEGHPYFEIDGNAAFEVADRVGELGADPT